MSHCLNMVHANHKNHHSVLLRERYDLSYTCIIEGLGNLTRGRWSLLHRITSIFGMFIDMRERMTEMDGSSMIIIYIYILC